MKSFVTPSFSVPVLAEPDVCVVGGGAAGVAAAAGAARSGLSVLLIEKYGFCGGATVAGLSGTICGLYASGGPARQVVFGFAGEFASALRARGALGDPVRFGRTWLAPHDPLGWKETADALLDGAKAAVRFHTVFLKAFAEPGGPVHTLLVRGPEGMYAVRPRAVVDASGDAEVVASLGGRTGAGRDGVVQTPTMVFRMGGVDMGAFLATDPAEIERLAAEADRSGLYRLPRHHVYAFPMPNRAEVLCNMTRIARPDGRAPDVLEGGDLSWAEAEGRRQAREYARFLRDRVPGFARAHLVDTGAQVGIRQTRSIAGVGRLTNADVLSGRKFEGAASLSAWPIEVHEAGGGVTIRYLEGGTYDIPFEALLPESGPNLVVAGRCLSAEHEALASARVTAQCLGMGYAAGAACGLMLASGAPSQGLTGAAVRDWMRGRGLKSTSES
jgi:2-polyprenyl-6-methoxyphenol hydroxylase-like FAD-dependent oxidoreductase